MRVTSGRGDRRKGHEVLIAQMPPRGQQSTRRIGREFAALEQRIADDFAAKDPLADITNVVIIEKTAARAGVIAKFEIGPCMTHASPETHAWQWRSAYSQSHCECTPPTQLAFTEIVHQVEGCIQQETAVIASAGVQVDVPARNVE